MYIRAPPSAVLAQLNINVMPLSWPGHFRLILQDAYRRLDKVYDPVRARLSFR